MHPETREWLSFAIFCVFVTWTILCVLIGRFSEYKKKVEMRRDMDIERQLLCMRCRKELEDK